MTNPSVLLELAGRVEALPGRDMQLGREVLIACGWVKSSRGHFMGPLYGWLSPDFKVSFDDDDFRLHDPTASIDAVTTLMPESTPDRAVFWRSGNDGEGGDPSLFMAEILVAGVFTSRSFTAVADTEPLARLAACLRALAAREG